MYIQVSFNVRYGDTMFKHLKMRYKILFPVSLVIILVLVAMMFVVQDRLKEQALTDARRLAQEISSRYANMVKGELGAVTSAAKALAAGMANERAQPEPDRRVAAGLLHRTLDAFPGLFGVWTAWEPNAFDGRDAEFVKADALHEESGRFLAYIIREKTGTTETHTTVVNATSRAEDDKWYWQPLQTKRVFLTDPTTYEVAGQNRMMISVCVPLFEQGQAVVGADLSLEGLQALAARVQVFDTGYGFLLSQTGMVVAHPDKDLIGVNFRDHIADANRADFETSLAQGEQVLFTQYSNTTHQDMLYCMTPISLEGVDGYWNFVINIPQEAIFAGARDMQTLLLGLSLGGLVLLVVLVYGIIGMIVKPVGEITVVAQAIAAGDLDRNIGIQQRDEIGILADSLRGMVASLKGKIETANVKTREAEEQSRLAREAMDQAEAERRRAALARAEGLAQAGARLERITSVIVDASERMAAQTRIMLQGADEQGGRIQGTATAMEEMNATVLEIARNASQAAEVGQQAQSKAEEGAGVVEQAKATMGQVVSEVDVLKHNMAELGTQAQGIGAIIGVIDDIADQTNLLALNAAIEAARAGDAGRGFAVVADEVRKLAEKTMTATKEVSASISAIQSAAMDNIGAMDSAFGRITEADRYSSRSGEVLLEIVSQSEASAAQIRSIATAAEEQSAASEEINHAIDDINRITQETSRGAREVGDSISGMAAQIAELNAIVMELKSSKADE
ncbi:MAG: methyl-accepting chemotaxis protein [Deltaproteobacteria bacterium]|nr:methyl-accepting chemotaxis protein [Deltaproteobacteria bacterium]